MQEEFLNTISAAPAPHLSILNTITLHYLVDYLLVKRTDGNRLTTAVR